jgi:(2Fe-2S) ferredoxin
MLREAYLFVCTNRRPDGTPKGSCAARGSEAVLAAMKALVAERGLGQTRLRCCQSSCLDFCAEGPTVLLVPSMTVFRRVRVEDVPDIVAAAEASIAEKSSD